MLDKVMSQSLRIFVDVFGQIQRNHQPNVVGHQEHIPVLAVWDEEGVEKVVDFAYNSLIIGSCIFVTI